MPKDFAFYDARSRAVSDVRPPSFLPSSQLLNFTYHSGWGVRCPTCSRYRSVRHTLLLSITPPLNSSTFSQPRILSAIRPRDPGSSNLDHSSLLGCRAVDIFRSSDPRRNCRSSGSSLNSTIVEWLPLSHATRQDWHYFQPGFRWYDVLICLYPPNIHIRWSRSADCFDRLILLGPMASLARVFQHLFQRV